MTKNSTHVLVSLNSPVMDKLTEAIPRSAAEGEKERNPAEVVSRKTTSGKQTVLILSTLSVLLLLLLNVFRREYYSGDEGFYGVTALNMLHSPTYLLRPSYFPAGDFLQEKDAFAHPPFNSYFYALSLWLLKGSLAGPELLNVISFALLLYFSYRIVALFDPLAAGFAVVLLAVSPAIAVYYSQLEAEPLLTTFGIMGLYCALRVNFAAPQKLLFLLSGLCLGFAFALKLWLVGPLALATASALWIRSREAEQVRMRSKAGPLGIFLLGAVAPAGLHLLAIASFYPQDLSFWLKNIYFGFFTAAGISGTKLDGSGIPAEWVHPIWYYAAALYRDHFFLVPFILLGLRPLLRNEGVKSPLLWITLAGLAGLLPLSLIKVKEPLYVLSCSIFLYVLAGCCLSALVREFRSENSHARPLPKFALVGIVGLLLLIPMAYARGIQSGKITLSFVIAHSVIFASSLILFWVLRGKRTIIFERAIYAGCIAALLMQFGYNFATRRATDKTIAQIIQPYVQDNSPQSLSLIASNFKSYQFYSFRRGCYWHELPLQENPEVAFEEERFRNVRAFILDTDEQNRSELKPWVGWLKTHAIEKTGELDNRLGKASGFLLFVRERQR